MSFNNKHSIILLFNFFANIALTDETTAVAARFDKVLMNIYTTIEEKRLIDQSKKANLFFLTKKNWLFINFSFFWTFLLSASSISAFFPRQMFKCASGWCNCWIYRDKAKECIERVLYFVLYYCFWVFNLCRHTRELSLTSLIHQSVGGAKCRELLGDVLCRANAAGFARISRTCGCRCTRRSDVQTLSPIFKPYFINIFSIFSRFCNWTQSK